MSGPCFPRDVSKNDIEKALTPERVAGIWRFAKDNFIDKGVSFEDTLSQMADITGLPRDWVARSFLKNKTVRPFAEAAFKQQELRHATVRAARNYVATIDDPAALKLLTTALAIPRRVLTFGHGPVFPVTHALDLIGSEWSHYWRMVGSSWKFASKAQHAVAMDWLRNHPDYAWFRKAGLVIDPAQGPSGILTGGVGKTSWAMRSWDSLKIGRLRLMEERWNKVPEAERTLDAAKQLANQINHSTGVMSPSEWGFGVVSRGMFAPQLTASKIAKTLVDPYKTGITGLKVLTEGKENVPFADRYTASLRTRKAAAALAGYVTLLGVNQGFLKASGSDQEVNFFDPSKSDWLRPKAFGHTLNTRGSMELVRLLGNLIRISQADRKELFGKSRSDASREAMSRYAEYKADPMLQNAKEVIYGEDAFGRPMPWTDNKGSKSKQKYSWSELALSKGPIWFNGATREIYDTLREHGVAVSDITQLIRALANNPEVMAQGAAIGLGEAVGGGIQPDRNMKKKSEESPPF